MSLQLKLVAANAVEAIDSVVDFTESNDRFKVAVRILDDAITTDNTIHFLGMGKSGIVAQKAAASFRSFGIRAFYLDAGTATHGDIGSIFDNDVVVAITHSGETSEVVSALYAVDLRCSVNVIVVTSDAEAAEVLQPQVALVYEADDIGGFAPSASCIAQLVFLDGLLAAVVDDREIGKVDFAMNHPGGSLGRQLTTDNE